MNNNDLKMIIAVAETGKIAGAAERLYVSQPYLSKKIAEIEAECGLPLFERHNRGTVLTDAGETVYKHAKEIMAEYAMIEADLAKKRERANSLVISYTTNGVIPYVAAIVKKLDGAANVIPKSFLSITMETGIKMNMFAPLERSLCDLFLTFRPSYTGQLAKWADGTVIEAGGLCAFVNREHPLAGLESVTSEQVLAYPVLLPPCGAGDNLSESMQAALGCPQENVVYCKDSTDFTIMTISRDSVGVMPYSSRTLENEYVRCLKIADSPTAFDLMVIWRRNDENPVLHRVLSILLK